MKFLFQILISQEVQIVNFKICSQFFVYMFFALLLNWGIWKLFTRVCYFWFRDKSRFCFRFWLMHFWVAIPRFYWLIALSWFCL